MDPAPAKAGSNDNGEQSLQASRRPVLLIVGATLAVVLTVVIGVGTMPWPGDVALARITQSLFPAGPGWAQWLSHTAEAPREFVVLALVIALAAWWVGWRGGVLAIASFIGMWVLDKLLRLVIFQPRPDPSLIHVVGDHPPGSSFPSTFALIYGASFGYLAVLGAARARGGARVAALVIGIGLLVAGYGARIVLGAHWPSEVAVSYLLALVWAGFLLRWVPTIDAAPQ